MSKCFFIFVFFAVNILPSFSQWSDIYTSSNNFYGFFLDIHFVNEMTGFAANDDSAITKTTNGGLSWTNLSNTSGYRVNKIQFTSANTGYAVGMDFLNIFGYLLKTTNAGNNWTVTQFNNTRFMSLKFIDDNLGYIITDSNFVYKTTNGGVNFTAQSLIGGLMISIDFVDANTGFVAGDFLRLYKTTNGGANWTLNSAPMINGMDFLNASLGYAAASNGNSGLIVKTTNGGSTWAISYTKDSAYFTQPFFLNDNTGWVAGGVYRSNFVYYRLMMKTTNGGNTWFEQSTGSQPDTSSCLGGIFIVDGNTGYVNSNYCQGLNAKLFKTTNGGGEPIGINGNEIELKDFKLNQNYPNPFNPSTLISFTIPKKSYVTVKVYDSIGNELAVLSEGYLNEGFNEIIFDGEGYSSGVYFYKIETEEFSDTKKMVLIK